MQLFNLEDDIGVVTGALGKLGPIWVETLLAAGARVLALDRPGQPAIAGIPAMCRPASGPSDWRLPLQTSVAAPNSRRPLLVACRFSAHRPFSSTTPASTRRRRPAARDTGWRRFRWP